jgi:hypothetical protein
MNRRRLRFLIAALASASLVFAAFASAARTVVAATGTIVGSGGSYTLVVRNTSTAAEMITCIRYFAPAGTTITGVTGLGSPSSFDTGFGAQGLSIAPNAASTFAFTTSQPLAPGNNGSLRVSADCVTDVAGTLSGPGSAPPPGAPCNCISLDGQVVPQSVKVTAAGSQAFLKLKFTVSWSMTCTKGTGGCVAGLQISAGGLKARVKPTGGKIRCVTNCGTTKTGVAHVSVTLGPEYGHDARRGKTLTLSVKRTCQGKTVAPQTFVFVFNQRGLVDKRKSKFK